MIEMANRDFDQIHSLDYYLALQYSFNVLADPDGGYVVVYPDLPGCMTQADSLEELHEMAEDARLGWIETEYELGHEIPLPVAPVEYSGKFNVRIPKSLHRSLAEAAEEEGVSLNQYVVSVLSKGDAQARIERRLHEITLKIDAIDEGVPYRFSNTPRGASPSPRE